MRPGDLWFMQAGYTSLVMQASNSESRQIWFPLIEISYNHAWPLHAVFFYPLQMKLFDEFCS